MLHLLALAVAISPLEWITTHMQLVGWPAIVMAAYWVGRQFQKVNSQIIKTVGQIDTMATNHFPHMEQSLAKQDIHLENIDRNIGRLADRI